MKYHTLHIFNKLQIKVVLFFCLVFLVGKVVAIEEPEKDSSQDAGLAAVWIMSQITQGGYLKPSVNLTNFNDDVHFMGELEAGWRFTNLFKFGASLKRTFSEVEGVSNHVTSFGFVAGVSGFNPALGDFTIDLNVGSLDTGDLDNARYFIEPGLQVKRRLYKRLYWTSGITYRYVEDESIAVFGNNSLNSISLKLGLTGSKY